MEFRDLVEYLGDRDVYRGYLDEAILCYFKLAQYYSEQNNLIKRDEFQFKTYLCSIVVQGYEDLLEDNVSLSLNLEEAVYKLDEIKKFTFEDEYYTRTIDSCNKLLQSFDFNDFEIDSSQDVIISFLIDKIKKFSIEMKRQFIEREKELDDKLRDISERVSNFCLNE